MKLTFAVMPLWHCYVLFRFFEKDASSITFQTMSGALTVLKKGNLLEMDFPAYELKQIPVTPAMEDAFGVAITEAWLGRDLLCVTENAEAIPTLTPNQAKLMELDGLLQHITARGKEYDSVSAPLRKACSRRGPRLRQRSLPHCSALGKKAGEGKAGGTAGIQAWRHAVLRNARG